VKIPPRLLSIALMSRWRSFDLPLVRPYASLLPTNEDHFSLMLHVLDFLQLNMCILSEYAFQTSSQAR